MTEYLSRAEGRRAAYLKGNATGDPSVQSRIVYTVGHNTPGYLPESDTWSYDAPEGARSALVDDLDRAADFIGEMDDCDEGVISEYEGAIMQLKSADVSGGYLAYLPTSTSSHDLGHAYWIDVQELTEGEYQELMDYQERG